jgi:hypothetical protein
MEYLPLYIVKNTAACRFKECENATLTIRTLIRTFKLSTDVRLPKMPACFKTQAFVEKASRCSFFLKKSVKLCPFSAENFFKTFQENGTPLTYVPMFYVFKTIFSNILILGRFLPIHFMQYTPLCTSY